MESTFEVAIDIDVEYEVGSPPTGAFDPYLVASPGIVHHESIWATREGPDEGDITTATTALYPNFSDVLRRQVFGVAMFGTAGTIAVTWGGVSFPVGRIWLNTDPGWAASGVVITSAGEGAWFACEGELETDFRIMKPGSSEPFSLTS